MIIKERVYVIEVGGVAVDTVNEADLYRYLADMKKCDVDITPIGENEFVLNNINNTTGYVSVLTESAVLV